MKKLFVMCAIVGLSCTGKQRPLEIYEIPYGYVGWVRIDYDQTACRNSSGPILVSSDGRACKPSSYEEGVARDEFYYVGPEGRELIGDDGSLILNRTYNVIRDADGEIVDRYEEFFVGTRQQLKVQAPSPWSLLRAHGLTPGDQPSVKKKPGLPP